MASDSVKHMPIHGVSAFSSVVVEIKNFFAAVKPRKTSTFVYAFVVTFVAFTVFLAFSPSPITVALAPSISSYILPNITVSNSPNSSASTIDSNFTTLPIPAPENLTAVTKNVTFEPPIANGTTNPTAKNNTFQFKTDHAKKNISCPDNKTDVTARDLDKHGARKAPLLEVLAVNSSASPMRKQRRKSSLRKVIESLKSCEFFEGDWVKDDSYPLYKPGSCNLIDEQFNCISNGRPDVDFQKLKWKPKKCSLPR